MAFIGEKMMGSAKAVSSQAEAGSPGRGQTVGNDYGSAYLDGFLSDRESEVVG
jgi:hypothetical protein